MAKKIGQLDYDWDNPEPEPVLTFEQQMAADAEHYLSLLPEHTGSALHCYAYEHGHSAGDYEINQIFCELAWEVIEAMRNDGLIK
jgi:hypothetical protein